MSYRWHAVLRDTWATRALSVLVCWSLGMPAALALPRTSGDTLRAVSTRGGDGEELLRSDLGPGAPPREPAEGAAREGTSPRDVTTSHVRITIPEAWLRFTGGVREVVVPGRDLAEAAPELFGRFPELKFYPGQQMLDADGRFKPFLNWRPIKGGETDAQAGSTPHVRITIPREWRQHTRGEAEVILPGRDLAEAAPELFGRFPELKFYPGQQMLDADGKLKPVLRWELIEGAESGVQPSIPADAGLDISPPVAGAAEATGSVRS